MKVLIMTFGRCVLILGLMIEYTQHQQLVMQILRLLICIIILDISIVPYAM